MTTETVSKTAPPTPKALRGALITSLVEAVAEYNSGATVKEAAQGRVTPSELNREIARLRKEEPWAITRPKFSKPPSAKGPRDPQLVIDRRLRREIKDWVGLRKDLKDCLSDWGQEFDAIADDIVELVRLHLGEKIKES